MGEETADMDTWVLPGVDTDAVSSPDVEAPDEEFAASEESLLM